MMKPTLSRTIFSRTNLKNYFQEKQFQNQFNHRNATFFDALKTPLIAATPAIVRDNRQQRYNASNRDNQQQSR
jgi:hypothetical protein